MGRQRACAACEGSGGGISQAALASGCSPVYELNRLIRRPVPVSESEREKGAVKRSEANVPGHRG
ncbi:MAG: hypothetical protein PHI28_08300 [Mangrovibacterium sp.]|nr:hypothetical protein [Mangrovibacterium sp.]